MAEEKSAHQSIDSKMYAARWSNSVNQKFVVYDDDFTVATSTRADQNTNVRTIFFKTGHHVLNIKLKKMGHIGIGIVDTQFVIADTKVYIGADEHSYGIWNGQGMIHKSNAQNTDNSKYKTGDIITVDLNLNDRTVGWEINGQPLFADIKISLNGPIAIAVGLYHIQDSVQIIQHLRG